MKDLNVEVIECKKKKYVDELKRYEIYINGVFICSCLANVKENQVKVSSAHKLRSLLGTDDCIGIIKKYLIEELNQYEVSDINFYIGEKERFFFDTNLGTWGIAPLDALEGTNLTYMFTEKEYSKLCANLNIPIEFFIKVGKEGENE